MTAPRTEINMADDTVSILNLMSDGNLGAASVLKEAHKANPDYFLFFVLTLDDMNIRGEQLWVAYSYFCHGDVPRLIQAVQNGDAQMVKMINNTLGKGSHKAVVSGGSKNRELIS